MNTHPAVEYFESRLPYFSNMVKHRLHHYGAQAAKEVLQSARINMWRGWGGHKVETREGWANEVVYRAILEFIRDRKYIKNSICTSLSELEERASRASLGGARLDAGDIVPALRTTPSMEAQIDMRRLAGRLVSLAPKVGREVVLRALLGQAPKDISQELGYGIGKTKAIIFKFRRVAERRLGIESENKIKVHRTAHAA